MKKLIVAASFTFCLLQSSHAQVDTRPFVFSASPEISLPIGKFGETNKLGFGGNFVAQFLLAEKLRLLTSIGGTLYQGKEYTLDQFFPDQYPATAVLGVRGGLKYYLLDAVFVAGNIGGDRVTQSGESKIGFSYTPVVGAELGGVDLYLKYNVIGVKSVTASNRQTVGFCIGYRL